MTTVYDFNAVSIDGQDRSLDEFSGQAILIVNTASKCGFTPQYRGLEQLYRAYGAQGFSVLGFPCDQFAHQEPADEEQIASFCHENYAVTFPMFAKIDVNGKQAHPLWSWLRDQQPGLGVNQIKWNFTKFLADRGGHVVRRYSPATKPAQIGSDIEQVLA